jgi:hypothetical protein
MNIDEINAEEYDARRDLFVATDAWEELPRE